MLPPLVLLKAKSAWTFIKNYWPIILAVILTLLLMWAIHRHGYNAGKDKVQAEWNEAKIAQQDAVIAQQLADAMRVHENNVYTLALLKVAKEQAERDEEEIENEIAANPADNSLVLSDQFVQAFNRSAVSGK